MRRARTLSLGVLASLLSHAGAMFLLRDLPTAATRPAQAEQVDFTLAFPLDEPAGAPATLANAQQEHPLLLAGGPTSQSNLDRDQREGQSGDGSPEAQGVLLFQFASPVTLQDTDLNNLAANQAQRIKTASDRASEEQRRATPQPRDEVFLASGDVGHRERRTPSHHDSAAGAPSATKAAEAGATEHREGVGTTAHVAESAPSRSGDDASRPAAGIQQGQGRRESERARVAFARPNVDRGPSATTSEAQDSRVRDDMNAELLAARMQRSMIDASLARGDANAQGHGGRDAGRTGTARGDHGDGSTALPFTPGEGRDGVLDTQNGRYVRWFVQQKARVEAGLVFPLARAIAKDQGTSLYRVIVSRSGAMMGAPHLLRSSGYADFDAAARAAIRKAAPFPPLPSELMQDREELTLLIPISFANPMVE